MTAPAGSEAQFGYRFASALTSFGESIWQGPVNKFLRFISMEGMNADYQFTPVDNMDPSNQTLTGDATQGAVTPKLSLNPDVNSISPILAHHCGKDPVITTPAGATNARQWVLTPWEYGDAAPASHIDSLILEHYDGQECGLVEGARLQDLTIKGAQGKNIIVDLGFVACSDTYESDATQLAVGTYTGKPILLGQRAASLAGLPLKVKVTAAAAGGNDGTVKITVGAYAGATTIPIFFNKRIRVQLDDGSYGGVNREQDLWILFPSTSPATTLALDDEWSFSDTRTPATPSYSALSVLKGTGVAITVGGVEYLFQDFALKISLPRKANYVLGRMFPIGVDKDGKWSLSIDLNRHRSDTDFVQRLRRMQSFTARVEMFGAPIEANIFAKWQVDVNGKVSSIQRGVTNPNTQQEKLVIMGERSGSTDIVTHTVINSLAALAA